MLELEIQRFTVGVAKRFLEDGWRIQSKDGCHNFTLRVRGVECEFMVYPVHKEVGLLLPRRLRFTGAKSVLFQEDPPLMAFFNSKGGSYEVLDGGLEHRLRFQPTDNFTVVRLDK